MRRRKTLALSASEHERDLLVTHLRDVSLQSRSSPPQHSGNTSNAKSVGEGVHELKVDFGPGYRIYFGWDGPMLVILLGGGTKKGQDRDIKVARACWRDYKVRKKAAE